MTQTTQAAMFQWVIYDHPKDFPLCYVARKWVIVPGSYGPTDHVLLERKIENLRTRFELEGLVCIPRADKDDPTIVEVWL